MSGQCEGMTGEAAAGEIALLTQPDLPHRAAAHDLRVTSLLPDQSVVSSAATGLPSSQAPLPVRFSSFAPVCVASARQWKNTLTYVTDSVLGDDSIATPQY